ncbi:hypothetical protein [Pseudotenacibaculum haliotis]|uniref:Uncharacterized protein n=1 Tax=Pseudotenacibaculum haliotis TaxID=1862138 RepID=A0ABW5LQC3_9FLAO
MRSIGIIGSHITAEVTHVSLPLLNQRGERELLKQLRHEHTWVAEIPSKQKWVNNDVIKIPKRGEAPKVLINNTQYPIVKNKRDDSHIILGLNKFDTENTEVSLDELYALPYEKVSDVQMQHRETLEDETMEYGLYGIPPTEKDEANNLFIIETTGPDRGDGTLKLVKKDLRTLQEKMNKAGISKKGRILVLCDEHETDLYDEDSKFENKMANHKEGTPAPMLYGFKIYVDSTTPEYDDNLEKLPYQSVDVGRKSSVVFHKKATGKANGTVVRIALPASMNPEGRAHVIGYQFYHVIVAYGVEGSAAVVDGKTPPQA